MRLERDKIVFSTGREVYIHAGIVGLDDSLRTYYGYDGNLNSWPREWADEEGFTKAERQELADHMIALWREFRTADAPKDEPA